LKKKLILASALLTACLMVSACSQKANSSNTPADQGNASVQETTTEQSKNEQQEKEQPESDTSELKILSTNKQYGNESFLNNPADKLENVSVNEINGTIVVSWLKDNSIYMSFGKDGTWITKEKEVYKLDDDKLKYYRSYGMHFIISGTDVVAFDEQGNVKESKVNGAYSMWTVNTNEGEGYLYLKHGEQGNIYNIQTFKGMPLDTGFTDKYKVFSNTDDKAFPSNRSARYMDLKTEKFYFGGHYADEKKRNIKVIDMKTGEPLYDTDGNDKEAPMAADLMTGADNGMIYAFDTDYSKLGLIDSDLNLLSSINVPVSGALEQIPKELPHLRYDVFLTSNENELHFWSIVHFQHNLSLELITVSKHK